MQRGRDKTTWSTYGTYPKTPQVKTIIEINNVIMKIKWRERGR